MMRGVAPCLASVLACMPLAPAWGVEDIAPAPQATVASPETVIADIDHLLLLQDATANGDAKAMEEQKELLRRIGEELQGQPPKPSSPLAHRIIAYVMSGGDPRLGEKLSQDAGFNPRDRKLMEAAARFMQGDRAAVAPVLSKLDPLQLPARIAGRIALAQALLAHDDARQDSFAVALSAMPGTLVEESALRRSALAYAEARDEPAFWRRLERYGRRFPESIYAAGFWTETIQALVAWSSKPPGPDLRRLDTVLAVRTVAERRRLYLALARLAAASSNKDLTGFAARRLDRLAEPGSVEAQLALFYMNLYGIVSAQGDSALRRLRSLPHERLGTQEQALLIAVLALGAMIERPEPSAPSDGGEAANEPTPQEQRGATLLAASASLLSELN